MKKELVFIIVCVVAVGATLFLTRQGSEESSTTKTEQNTPLTKPATDTTDLAKTDVEVEMNNEGEQVTENNEDVKPASDVYKSSDEAFAAIKNGAKSYDDIVLEQFVEPGEKCTWCTDLYAKLNSLLLDPNTTDEERAYFAEIMAISGKIENVKSIAEKVEAAVNSEQAETFAEALELTYGDSSTVDYLGTLMSSENKLLKDSSIAAVTNHGTKQAAEMLYSQATKDNNPDGYYSIGSGLGELTPDPEAIPFLKEKAELNNEYSHLAVKALLNSGTQGVREVIQMLNKQSKNPDMDKKLMENSLDHIAIDEETEVVLREALKSATTERAKQFIQQALSEIPPQSPEPGSEAQVVDPAN